MGEGSRRPSGMLMSVDLEPVQLVGPDGTPTAERRYHRDLPEETLRWLYEMMVVTRELDTEFVNLQRQGELALYTPCRGQEAAQVGAAACLRKTDWLFPQYRELGVYLVHPAWTCWGRVAWNLARRAAIHHEVLCTDVGSHRHPDLARGGRGDGRATPGRGLRDGGLSGRRRHQRGRRT